MLGGVSYAGSSLDTERGATDSTETKEPTDGRKISISLRQFAEQRGRNPTRKGSGNSLGIYLFACARFKWPRLPVRSSIPVSTVSIMIIPVRIMLFDLIEHYPKQILPLKFRRGLFCDFHVRRTGLDYEQYSVRQISQDACIVNRHGRRRIDYDPIEHWSEAIQ